MLSQTNRGLVLDTSAAVAVILGESDSDDLLALLDGATVRQMAAATRVELGIVIEARLWPFGMWSSDSYATQRSRSCRSMVISRKGR